MQVHWHAHFDIKKGTMHAKPTCELVIAKMQRLQLQQVAQFDWDRVFIITNETSIIRLKGGRVVR